MRLARKHDSEVVFAWLPVEVPGLGCIWMEWYQRRFEGLYYNVQRVGIPFREGVRLWFSHLFNWYIVKGDPVQVEER